MHQGNRPQYFWNICFSFCLLVFLTFCIVIIQHHCLKVKSLTTIIKKIVLKRNSSQEDKSQSSQIVTKLRRFEESYCAAALSAASSVSLLSFHLSFFSNSIWCKYIFIHSFWFFVAIRSHAFSAFSRWSFLHTKAIISFKSRWQFTFCILKIEIIDLKQWPAALILYFDASVVDTVIDGNHPSVLLSPLHSFLSIIVNLVLVNLNYHVVNEVVKVGTYM